MIRLENLWKRCGRFDALRGLSLRFPRGSAFAMIGANGAGKTTIVSLTGTIAVRSGGKSCRASRRDAAQHRPRAVPVSEECR